MVPQTYLFLPSFFCLLQLPSIFLFIFVRLFDGLFFALFYFALLFLILKKKVNLEQPSHFLFLLHRLHISTRPTIPSSSTEPCGRQCLSRPRRACGRPHVLPLRPHTVRRMDEGSVLLIRCYRFCFSRSPDCCVADLKCL